MPSYSIQVWDTTPARGSYYFSGKGFQKIGSLCLLLEDFYGISELVRAPTLHVTDKKYPYEYPDILYHSTL